MLFYHFFPGSFCEEPFSFVFIFQFGDVYKRKPFHNSLNSGQKRLLTRHLLSVPNPELIKGVDFFFLSFPFFFLSFFLFFLQK